MIRRQGEYESDRRWSDSKLAAVRTLLATRLITIAPDEEDTERATDLIALPRRIAVRVRDQANCLPSYQQEVTFRSSRSSGAKTELEKILEGHGDLFFYAFWDGQQITRFVLLDLDILRAIHQKGWLPPRQRPNPNDGGRTWFVVVPLADIRPCVLEDWWLDDEQCREQQQAVREWIASLLVSEGKR